MDTSRRRPSKAEVRRRVAQRRTEASLPQPAPELAAYIDTFTPSQIEPAEWETIRPFVLDTVRRSGRERLESGRQRLRELAAYTAWAHQGRLDLTALTAMTATAPATQVLSLPGVGRDRLTVACAAAERPSRQATTRWLRGC